MNILDWIIIGAFAVALIIGVLKGILKQIFSIAGFFIVIFCTSLLAPYVQSWFAGVIESENTRMIIAMILSAVILIAGTAILSFVLRKILTRSKTIGAINRILGGVVAVVITYLAISVAVELILNTSDQLFVKLKEAVAPSFRESWIVNNLYKNNFFGRFVVEGIAKKIMESLQPVEPQAIAVQFLIANYLR